MKMTVASPENVPTHLKKISHDADHIITRNN